MKKILELISKLQKDKWMHFGVSTVLAAAIKLFASIFIPSYLYLFSIAFLVTVVIGAMKEIYDKRTGKGSPELSDFVADVLGAIVGAL